MGREGEPGGATALSTAGGLPGPALQMSGAPESLCNENTTPVSLSFLNLSPSHTLPEATQEYFWSENHWPRALMSMPSGFGNTAEDICKRGE